MTATNHAITGAIIGFLVHDPLLAIPAAIASHFVCDAIPHFDKRLTTGVDDWLSSSTFKKLLIADATCCIALVLLIAYKHPYHWFLISVCAFAATSPDMLWVNRFLKTNRKETWKPNLLSKFGSAIQWFAKPIGAIVELTWLICGLFIISIIVR
jgi:hypothetical protein